MKKVGIYGRLSEEDKDKINETDDSRSIQNQKFLLMQYAAEQNWEIYGLYFDDDCAGADRNRPEWKRLLEDAKGQKFDIVLCKSQSRFTRELEMVEKYIHGFFPLWGIRFVSIVDNADTELKGNKKSRQINGLVNEWYLEDMSENIKSVLTNRRKNGFHIGSFALYGYKKNPNQKGHLMIDEEAAAIVKEVFTLFIQGYGKTAIAKILNERGVPNPTEYKRIKGLYKKPPCKPTSTLWRYSTISSMLKNEMYIGNMVQGKYGSISYKTKQNMPKPKEQWYRVENTHEPIIDRELWNKVQNRTCEKAKPFGNGKIGLFAGKAKCMDCGYALCSSKNQGKYYLKCSTKQVSPTSCNGAFISVEVLEEAILAELHCFLTDYLNQEKLERNVIYHKHHLTAIENLQEENCIYTNRIYQCEKSLKTLYTDKVDGILANEEFIFLSKDYREDKKRLTDLINNNQSKIDILTREAQRLPNNKLLTEHYTALKKLDCEVVDTFIDYIYIGRKNRKTKELPIEIHWSF